MGSRDSISQLHPACMHEAKPSSVEVIVYDKWTSGKTWLSERDEPDIRNRPEAVRTNKLPASML